MDESRSLPPVPDHSVWHTVFMTAESPWINHVMKSLSRMILCLSVACVSAKGEIRGFLSNSGEVIKAELISHSAGKVKIKREDGREFEVDPAIFAAEDQKHIRKWMASQPETIRYGFNIAAKKKMMDRTGSSSSSYSKWAYEISITNTSQQAVRNLRIQYRVLYESYTDKIIEDEETLKEDLNFNRTLVITTKPVSVYKSRYGSNYRSGELKGCLVRIIDNDGNIIKAWVSSDVGMKDKNWGNTSPQDGRTPAQPPPVIR